MTFTLDEALQDAHEAEHGYDQDVTCAGCRKPLVVRFLDGEPVEHDALNCPCGDLREIV